MAMLDFVQQLVSGIALGCVYGLIALGFVLVYKATEVVNFAQGDLMMLGGFFAFTFIGILGLNYWIGFAAAVAAMALFGMLAERVVVRPILGYPQFSIIMATIGLGFPALCRRHDLGHRRLQDRDAVQPGCVADRLSRAGL
jgi:branched-chain amino acid transport system permease protein